MSTPRKSAFFDSPKSKKRKSPEVATGDFKVAFKKYPANGEKAALLIHGGCFVKGDENWNADQAKSIAKNCGLDVFTLDFSKISLESSVNDIKDFFIELRSIYKGNAGVIACSSGGFLALKTLNQIPTPLFTVLVCPVMNPELREDMLLATSQRLHNKNIQKNQFSYFKSKPYPKVEACVASFDIVAARDDENVPLALITAEAKRYAHATLHIIEGDHSRSFKPSSLVNAVVSEAVYKASVVKKDEPVNKKTKSE